MPSPYALIARRCNWLRLRANQLYGLEFPGLQIIYLPLDSNIAGYWEDGSPLIVLNENFVRQHPKWAARDLLVHEFSHLVVYHLDRNVPDHGSLFMRVCAGFGALPYRLHDRFLKGCR